MSSEKFQYDLFGENFNSNNKTRPRRGGKYSKQRFLAYIRIPIEYSVIIVIGVLIVVIIAYAVGVEKGKRMFLLCTFADAEHRNIPGPDVQREELPEKKKEVLTKIPEPAHEEVAAKSVQEDKPEEPVDRKRERIEEEPGETKEYEVQLASFKKSGFADKEVAKLKTKGIKARSVKKGVWYRVSVAGYKTIEAAKAAKKELIEDYKDCYIRRIQ